MSPGQGAHCSWGSGTVALCLALMPAFQGSPKIGSGNSWKVITWDSGNSRWFLRAAPQCSRGCVLSCSLSGLSLFFMFISGRNCGSSIHELSLSASPQPLADPFVSLGEKDTCSPIPSAPPRGSRKLALVIVNYLWKRQSPGLPFWQKLPDQQW